MRILPLAAALVLGTAAHAQQPAAPDAVPASGVSAARTVTVDMKDGKGQSVGTVQIRQLAHGTLFLADLRGLPPGAHGFHVHERGSCQAPDFKSAGSHYNPEQSEHVYGSGGGPHPGDLPNLHVTQQGTVTAEIHSSRLSLVDEDSA
ncbi:MAG: superoxide dismutase family protein, partial [Hyphomicrobiaceae bacterium]